MDARERLIALLREHALVIGEIVLTSGARASYYVDAKRATLLPEGFAALGELVAEQAREWRATAVGGLTMGADPVACAALAGGFAGKAFFVRKEVKAHGTSRAIEGPDLRPGLRVLLVDDTMTTGGTFLQAQEAVVATGATIAGALCVVDREEGGREALEAAGITLHALFQRSEFSPRKSPA